MRVPFLDLAAQFAALRDEVLPVVQDVLESTRYILGPEVEGFEREFSHAHDAQFGITTNNGTSALHLALWALEVGKGDEVIVPVNTFIATAEAVMLTGATPVFVDHDDYYTMDADQAARAIRKRTKALLPVHLYGQPANMAALQELAAPKKLCVVEDAAQAHLAKLHGKFVGSWSDATCFSFYPGKNLGAYGEGGAVITNDARLSKRMRLLRDHGSDSKYVHSVSGHNYRLEALQAAILRVKLRHLDEWTRKRQAHAARYTERLAQIPEVVAPRVRPQAEPVYHLFVIEADRRDALKEHLQSKNIDTGLHYPIPLHLQGAFASLGYKQGAFPKAEASAKRILSLPMYPELTDDQIDYVVASIADFYGHKL